MPLADRDPTRYAALLRASKGELFADCHSGTACEILWNAARVRTERTA